MKKFLLYSTAFVVLSGTANAACIQTPSCASLGYDSNSACENGLKCPWGNAWYCKVGELEEAVNNAEKAKTCIPGAVFNSDRSCTEKQELGKIPIGVVVYADGKGHGQAMALEKIDIVALNNYLKTVKYTTFSKYPNKYAVEYHYTYARDSSRDEEYVKWPQEKCISTDDIYVKGLKEFSNLEEASLEFDSKNITAQIQQSLNTNNANIQQYFNTASALNSIVNESKIMECSRSNVVGYPCHFYEVSNKSEYYWYSGDASTSLLKTIQKIKAYKTTGTSAGDWNMPAPGIFNSIKVNFEKIKETYALLNKNFNYNQMVTMGMYIKNAGEKTSKKCTFMDAKFTSNDGDIDKNYQSYQYDSSYSSPSDSYSRYYYYYLIPTTDFNTKLPSVSAETTSYPKYIAFSNSATYGTATTSSGGKQIYPVIDF